MGFLQIWDQFYDDVEASPTPQPGEIYWAPVAEIDECPRILNVKRADPQEHHATDFEIVEIAQSHFRARDRLPIKRLNLEATQELAVARCKKRPVLVISRNVVHDVDSLPEGAQKRLAKQAVGKFVYLVAPCYSVSKLRDPGTFGPVLVARIRAMQYLHLACLPERGNPRAPESIIRLDRVFPSYLARGCEHAGYRLCEEPFRVILSQFSLLIGGNDGQFYEEVKDVAKEALPEGLT